MNRVMVETRNVCLRRQGAENDTAPDKRHSDAKLANNYPKWHTCTLKLWQVNGTTIQKAMLCFSMRNENNYVYLALPKESRLIM